MRSLRHIVLSSVIAISTFSLVALTGCSDKCKNVACQHGGTCSSGNCACPTGYSGSNCETDVRTTYAHTYKGNGSDNNGKVYNNYSLVYNTSGTGVTTMTLTVLDSTNATAWNLNIALTTNSSYTVTSTTMGTDTYTGSGTLSATTATLMLTKTPIVGSATTYTFNNMIKQ